MESVMDRGLWENQMPSLPMSIMPCDSLSKKISRVIVDGYHSMLTWRVTGVRLACQAWGVGMHDKILLVNPPIYDFLRL